MTPDQIEAEAADLLLAHAQNITSTYTEPDDQDAATIALLTVCLERLTTRRVMAHMMETL